jgi:uncharacterized protein YPO0396
VDNTSNERRVELNQVKLEAKDINDELRSLRSRPSNLPMKSLEIRAWLVQDLGLAEEELPFAGELLQVRPDAQDWEGAAERVLHGFALSLLVPNEHYERAARWIDSHHLGDRLVYFRIPQVSATAAERPRSPGARLLVDCLETKPDTVFEPWLETELNRRANHACVESASEFRGVAKAVTRAGQIKDRDRHEKDDCRRIDDRRSYVLGWTNQAKIDALLEAAHDCNARLVALTTATAELTRRHDQLSVRLTALSALDEYTSSSELDWQQLARDGSARRAELRQLQESSDVLATLTRQRSELAGEIKELEQRISALQTSSGRLAGSLDRCGRGLRRTRDLLADQGRAALAQPWFERIDQLVRDQLGTLADYDQVDEAERRLSGSLTAEIEQINGRSNSIGQRVTRRMVDFAGRYPALTAEFDAAVASAREYRTLHQQVAEDDLPRFERDFKDYLNTNTIRDIAGFSAQLNKQAEVIEQRVQTVNESLVAIEYNHDRYIRLVPDRTPNVEVRTFISDLRACTDNVVGHDGSAQYSEQKFLQVKLLIDRFKGREQLTEVDRVWTRRVTDVRNWFVFSASERWRGDDSEHENYTDSGGKSGGQKEKLAYTILAASLAYQFKLDWAAKRSKSFRFVVIDEAFGRGSEESTRYALQLFTKLGLQLLIVTPLQKIHVIEPYVSAVGYVDNLHGNYSRLRGMTIEEYRHLRAQRRLPSVSAGEP